MSGLTTKDRKIFIVGKGVEFINSGLPDNPLKEIGGIIMVFFTPVLLLRRKVIVKRLNACGATSEKTAKTLAEAGVINPNGFNRFTQRLVEMGTIHMTSDGRYYV